jgi:hypothetical protein
MFRCWEHKKECTLLINTLPRRQSADRQFIKIIFLYLLKQHHFACQYLPQHRFATTGLSSFIISGH